MRQRRQTRPRIPEWQRRALLLAEALREVAERVAIEHVEDTIAQGRAPARAVTMLGRPADACMSKYAAIGRVRDAWLAMVRDDPAALAPYAEEIAARLALLEAAGRPYREIDHG